jgi:hypothetical protein
MAFQPAERGRSIANIYGHLTTVELAELVARTRVRPSGYLVELYGRGQKPPDRVWIRFHRRGGPSPLFGFARTPDGITVTLLGLDVLGITDVQEPCFPNVSAALDAVLEIVDCIADVSQGS